MLRFSELDAVESLHDLKEFFYSSDGNTEKVFKTLTAEFEKDGPMRCAIRVSKTFPGSLSFDMATSDNLIESIRLFVVQKDGKYDVLTQFDARKLRLPLETIRTELLHKQEELVGKLSEDRKELLREQSESPNEFKSGDTTFFALPLSLNLRDNGELLAILFSEMAR